MVDIKCTATLRSETNPADIIADMIDRYTDIPYNSANYDATEWTSESATLGDVYLFMKKEKNLFEYIEELQTASTINFYYYITRDGKRSMRIVNPDRTPYGNIDAVDRLNDTLSADRDNTDFATRLEVVYSIDISDDEGERYLNTAYEDSVYNQYHVRNEFTGEDAIESNLTSQADAITKSNELMEDYQLVKDVYEIIVKLSDFSDIEILDIVSADLSYPGEVVGQAESALLKADYDAVFTFTADYKASTRDSFIYLKAIDTIINQRDMFSTKECKVVGLAPNIEQNELTIKLRENS